MTGELSIFNQQAVEYFIDNTTPNKDGVNAVDKGGY